MKKRELRSQFRFTWANFRQNELRALALAMGVKQQILASMVLDKFIRDAQRMETPADWFEQGGAMEALVHVKLGTRGDAPIITVHQNGIRVAAGGRITEVPANGGDAKQTPRSKDLNVSEVANHAQPIQAKNAGATTDMKE